MPFTSCRSFTSCTTADKCPRVRTHMRVQIMACRRVIALLHHTPKQLSQIGSDQEVAASRGAAELVAACHAARQFTDTANFTLRCGVCQIGLKGEKEAAQHAQATGHTRFAEY